MVNAKRWMIIILAVGVGFLSTLPLTAQEVIQEKNAVWTLQRCIEYALQQNISIRKSKINAEQSVVDLKTAKAALLPNLSFSVNQNVVNRPYQESSSIISGSEVIKSSSKTSYNGNYGLNASWTVYNGNKRLNTIKQEKLNTEVAELDTRVEENNIQESITQLYVQILYAAESVKTNESTLNVSESQRDRGRELLAAGSIAQSDLAQLESQVSTDRYQVVTAQTTLKNYKLQLKQLLEIDTEDEMNIYIPKLGNENILSPLPEKGDVYRSALVLRPEINAGKLAIKASDLGVSIAKSGYSPSISLSAGIGTNHTSGSDFTFSEQVKNGWSNSIGLSVNVPIFNNRQTKSAVQKAKLLRETSQLNLLDQQKTLYKSIETLWQDAYTAQQRYSAADEKLQAMNVSYQLINEQFLLGMKNTLELLTEKNNLLQAQQELLQAKYMTLLNVQLLKFYQGEIGNKYLDPSKQ